MAWTNQQGTSGGRQTDYLNTADTAERPMVLASILFTLLFITAIALLLFSAGRWAYNKVNQADSANTATSQPANEESVASSGGSSTDSTGNSSEQNSTANDQQPSNDSHDTASSNASASNATGSETARPSTPSTGGTEQAESAGQDSNQVVATTVPNTGPSSIMSIFILTVLLATVAHYGWSLSNRR